MKKYINRIVSRQQLNVPLKSKIYIRVQQQLQDSPEHVLHEVPSRRI